MLVVTDIEAMYLPQPEDLIVNLSESIDLITSLLDSLPTLFSKTQIVDNCFVAALQAGSLLANPIGGKLIFFQVAQTIIKHPLLAPKTANTVDRLDLVNASNPYFINTGSELAHQHITCDLFIFTSPSAGNSGIQNSKYKNLATMADLARKSSGNLYYYHNFSTRT